MRNRIAAHFADGDRLREKRNLVRRLIAAEDRTVPLDDAAISLRLREQGLDVPRRMVTKLRKELGIASSRQRGPV
jgi:RNA polymerase sigma-54 factor